MKSIKIIIMGLLLTLIWIASVSGQILWSTTRPTVNGLDTRVIPMSSVKSEFFKIWDKYDWIFFDQRKNVLDRTKHTNFLEAGFLQFGAGWAPDVRRENEQMIRWLKSVRNFVHAHDTFIGPVIYFVIGDYVYVFTFSFMNTMGFGMSTRDRELRRSYEKFIDEIL